MRINKISMALRGTNKKDACLSESEVYPHHSFYNQKFLEVVWDAY